MSGIVGFFGRDGQTADRVKLERMAESLAHRGPNGAGIWCQRAVGFGHRLLWTTPESLHEQLPLTNKRGNLAITADARIDNRDELIASLGLGRTNRSVTDSELILHAYEHWGEDAPKRLSGDFAFAIWDDRHQRLFCARDHCGAKPFYYYQSASAMLFASEIKALLVAPEVPRRLNTTRVADYLAEIFEDQTSTFYRNVVRLQAGHTLTVTATGSWTRRYFSLDASRELRLGSDEEYVAAFLEHFTTAVRCRLRSAFPVGGLLSGGLDSSSIMAMARQVRGEDRARELHTFSAIFTSLPEADLRRIDERRFVEAVLALKGFTPHYVDVDQQSPLGELDRILWHEDEPCLAPNLYMHWALYKAAHQEQVRVLLDGVDGDTTVSHGLEYLSELARSGRVVALGREVMALSGRYKTPVQRVFWNLGLKPLVPEPLRTMWRRVRSGATAAHRGIINPVFARRVGIDRGRSARRRPPPRTARESHWRDLTSPLLPYALEIGDKAAAAFSLEPRYPFCDRRLMEFCLSVPAEQKLQQGWTRMIMRRAMKQVLPDVVRWRVGKADLSPNFKRQLLKRDLDILEDVIVKDPGVIEDYVDVDALRDAYGRYRAQPMVGGNALEVWSVVPLAVWLRQTDLAA